MYVECTCKAIFKTFFQIYKTQARQTCSLKYVVGDN